MNYDKLKDRIYKLIFHIYNLLFITQLTIYLYYNNEKKLHVHETLAPLCQPNIQINNIYIYVYKEEILIILINYSRSVYIDIQILIF